MARIIKRRLLTLLVVAMPLLGAWVALAQGPTSLRGAVEAEHPGTRWVTTGQLGRWLASDRPIVLLDARAPAEFAVSHLDGARRIDPEHPSAREIRALDRGARVVVYCSVGFRSAIIESWLHEQGFDDVYNLAGGLFEWANEGRPMIDGEGQSTDLVHPYDATWGRFLEESHRLPR